MIPRFSNPHFLPQIATPATRAQLYAIEDTQGEDIDENEDAAVIARLEEILSQNLPVLKDERLSRKRRKVTNDQEHKHELEQDQDQPVLFRLLSSALPPLPVSLLPPPPPPPITREPDIEDTDGQALLRKQRAAVSAIEAEVVLEEAKVNSSQPSCSRKSSSTFNLALERDALLPSFMIVQKYQNVRKTRPPVARARLQLYPYVPDKASIYIEPPKPKTMDCPVLDVKEVGLQPNKRIRRGGGSNEGLKKIRPPPQFWKPNPAWKGKCMGYGYGYPSSWFPEETAENRKYQRDSMKKALFSCKGS